MQNFLDQKIWKVAVQSTLDDHQRKTTSLLLFSLRPSFGIHSHHELWKIGSKRCFRSDLIFGLRRKDVLISGKPFLSNCGHGSLRNTLDPAKAFFETVLYEVDCTVKDLNVKSCSTAIKILLTTSPGTSAPPVRRTKENLCELHVMQKKKYHLRSGNCKSLLQ